MDVEAVRMRAEALLAKFEELRDGHEDLQRRLLAVQATVRSPDGLVEVTVGPRGQVVRVGLDPRIYRRPDSGRLAETVTETIQAATEAALSQTRALTRHFIPDAAFQAHLNFDFDSVLTRPDHELLRR